MHLRPSRAKHAYIYNNGGYTLHHSQHNQTLMLLYPGATIPFLAAPVVPFHFSSFHLRLFNKEASGSSEGPDGNIEWAFNSSWIIPGSLCVTEETYMAYLKGFCIVLKSVFPQTASKCWGNLFCVARYIVMCDIRCSDVLLHWSRVAVLQRWAERPQAEVTIFPVI